MLSEMSATNQITILHDSSYMSKPSWKIERRFLGRDGQVIDKQSGLTDENVLVGYCTTICMQIALLRELPKSLIWCVLWYVLSLKPQSNPS